VCPGPLLVYAPQSALWHDQLLPHWILWCFVNTKLADSTHGCCWRCTNTSGVVESLSVELGQCCRCSDRRRRRGRWHGLRFASASWRCAFCGSNSYLGWSAICQEVALSVLRAQDNSPSAELMDLADRAVARILPCL